MHGGHGSTGAGNDQIRFDVAFRALAPDFEIVTPIRDEGVTRERASRFLESRGLPLPAGADRASVNRGLWGTTSGGGWTHDPWSSPPPEILDPPPDAPAPTSVVIEWEHGRPTTPGSSSPSSTVASSPSWRRSPATPTGPSTT
ncbi:MAG: argininosuccinate synthase domain-containing protein [Gemmatimonadota bacterium]